MGSLAVLSTCVGGGIVGIPWSMYQTGIPLGLLINAVVACAVQYSCLLYLEAKNNVPIPLNSIYELSYVSLGRPSIFVVSTLQFISASGLNIIYFIVFGDAGASCVKSLFYPKTDNFLTCRQCYILILGALMVVPLLQKELKEIKAVSIILFISIGLFLALMLVQLEVGGSALNPDIDHSVYFEVKWDLKLISSLGIVLVAYAFSQNLFPIY